MAVGWASFQRSRRILKLHALWRSNPEVCSEGRCLLPRLGHLVSRKFHCPGLPQMVVRFWWNSFRGRRSKRLSPPRLAQLCRDHHARGFKTKPVIFNPTKRQKCRLLRRLARAPLSHYCHRRRKSALLISFRIRQTCGRLRQLLNSNRAPRFRRVPHQERPLGHCLLVKSHAEPQPILIPKKSHHARSPTSRPLSRSPLLSDRTWPNERTSHASCPYGLGPPCRRFMHSRLIPLLETFHYRPWR